MQSEIKMETPTGSTAWPPCVCACEARFVLARVCEIARQMRLCMDMLVNRDDGLWISLRVQAHDRNVSGPQLCQRKMPRQLRCNVRHMSGAERLKFRVRN